MYQESFGDIEQIIEELCRELSFAIFGAGETGRLIYQYLNNNSKCKVCYWVDTDSHRYSDEGIRPIEVLKNPDYDFVIIASSKIDNIKIMIEQLVTLGISISKMLTVRTDIECYSNRPQNTRSIVLLDPSVTSYNLGDNIIMKSVEREMNYLLKDYFCTRYSTHVPMTKESQLNNNFRNVFVSDSRFVKYIFCCGTDLLQTRMGRTVPQWNIGEVERKILKNVILLGVGSSSNNYNEEFDKYTCEYLRDVLSERYIHSVRNDLAVKMLDKIGIKSVNTGCPTLWRFTKSFCERIPTEKSREVVFCISEHKKEMERDICFINILRNMYDKIYFWPQNYYDYNYLAKLGMLDDIYVLKPNIEAYQSLLLEKDVDYVGTRVHGGIFAMQHMKRAIILAVDNRALFMGKEFGLNVINYGDWDGLQNKIKSRFATSINLPLDNIATFKNQFE